MTTPVSTFTIPYPDFKLNDTILPDEFDDNNSRIVTKTNELITQFNLLLTELASVVAGDSGAHNVGSAAIADVVGSTVYEQLVNLKAQIDQVVSDGVADGSVTLVKLSSDVADNVTRASGALLKDGSEEMTGTLSIWDNGVRPYVSAKLASAPITDYPRGISYMVLGTGTDGFPFVYGTVLTIHEAISRNVQFAYGKSVTDHRFRYWDDALSAWSAWYRYWNEGNDGTGSGLDADLLDGEHASAFAKVGIVNIFSPGQIFNGGPGGIKLKAGEGDHAFMEFYARTADLNARSGYFGYTSGGTTQLVITNDLLGGGIDLNTASGNVRIDGQPILHEGNSDRNVYAAIGTGTQLVYKAGSASSGASAQAPYTGYYRATGLWRAPSGTLSSVLFSAFPYGSGSSFAFRQSAATTSTSNVAFTLDMTTVVLEYMRLYIGVESTGSNECTNTKITYNESLNRPAPRILDGV